MKGRKNGKGFDEKKKKKRKDHQEVRVLKSVMKTWKNSWKVDEGVKGRGKAKRGTHVKRLTWRSRRSPVGGKLGRHAAKRSLQRPVSEVTPFAYLSMFLPKSIFG